MEPLSSYKPLKSADFVKNIKEKQEEYQQEQRREACNETLTLRNATKATPSAMRYMLRICEEYGREFCVSFNAAKSASMYCGKKTCLSWWFNILHRW